MGKGPEIICSEGWQNVGLNYASSKIGATATYTFEGTGIRLLACRYDDGGKAEVTLDGQPAEVVDQYGPGRDLPFNWERQGLAPGKHTIQLKVLGEKSPDSKAHTVNLAGFEVIKK